MPTKAGEKARLRTIKDLDVAASQLGQACRLILDSTVPDAELREAIFKALQREDLEAAVNQVEFTGASAGGYVLPRTATELGARTAPSPSASEDLHFGFTPAGKPMERKRWNI